MKQTVKAMLQYSPWLFLLFGMDMFFALLLWIADIHAFHSMLVSIVFATILLFGLISYVLVRRNQKKRQTFLAFLHCPDEYHEEMLLEMVGPAQREFVRMLGRALQERQSAYSELAARINDYEEYVEAWAHEIKIPLSLLTLLLDNRRDEFPVNMSSKLDYIRSRMKESIDQMLFYARLKGAKKDYLFEYIHIRMCIEEVLENYMPLLQEKGVQIQTDIGDDIVYSDRRGLSFLLGQIISNSMKYCGAEPEIAFTALKKEGTYVLCVKDNGIGVRSCDLPYIFEKGFTGDSGEGRKKATGMGLYLAKGIAGEMNISLNAVSEWGHGFEIQICFPVVEKKEEGSGR